MASNTSAYEISKCVITSFDGSRSRDITSNFVGAFDLSQSMFKTSYTGSIVVLDGAGILDGLPIRGEETIELEITTVGPDQYTLNLVGHLYKVSNITPSQGSDSVTYTIHFMSRASFFAATHTNISAGYRSSMSYIAEQVFRTYFGKLGADRNSFREGTNRIAPFLTYNYDLADDPGRKFYIQPTEGISNFVIPDLTAQEAMYMLASRAYASATPSLTHRFFETFENYYFCTDEYFIADVKEEEVVKLFYAPVVDHNGAIEGQTQRVESLQIANKGIDSINDIYSGSYRSRVTEIDLIRGAVDYRDFNFNDTRFIDMSGAPRDLNFNPHTDQFRTQMFREDNAKQFTVIRDYTRRGDIPSTLNNDRNLSEIIQNRTSYYHHLNNTSVMANMTGRLDLRPGMIADLDLLSLSGLDQGTGLNKTMSGRYLIQAVDHSSNGEGSISTQIRMAKFDWSGGATQPAPSATAT